MRAAVWIVTVVLAIASAGCSNKKSLLVGTWKAEPSKKSAPSNIKDAVTEGLYSFATDGMTVEFNDNDRFKISVFIGTGTGTYSVSGDVVDLDMESKEDPGLKFAVKDGKLDIRVESDKDQQPLKFKFKDDRTLESVTEFASDPKIILRKQ